MHHYKTLGSITANWSCFYRTTIPRTTSDHLEPSDTINLHKPIVVVCLKEYAAVQNLSFFFSGKDSSCGLQGYDNVSLVYGCQHFKDNIVVSSWRVKCPMKFISSLNVQTLKMRSTCSPKIFGNKHLVTEHNIPEKMSSQLHCFESLKTHKIYIFF